METSTPVDRPDSRASVWASSLPGARKSLSTGFWRTIDFLLPPHCPVCRNAVASRAGVCNACWSALDFIAEPYCQVYGTPFAFDVGDAIVSAQAIAEPPPFNAARAAVKYGTVAKALIHNLKYRDRFESAEPMVTAMRRVGSGLLERCDLIVPVPLHRMRLLSRRFNQAGLLAAGLAGQCSVPSDPFVLQRRRRTRQQVGLSANERDANVRGAFFVPASQRARIAGRNVLLVDDVYTSGATVKAACRALLRGGAISVDVLTFANVCR